MKNESAFPNLKEVGAGSWGIRYSMTGGLTKREWFAGLAMLSFKKKHLGEYSYNDIHERKQHKADAQRIAQSALLYADALIAELERKEE